ncbi:hypothetical protein [Nocardioides speluncae]|uniref:hypothetical protein n=1 Tax=Nocardioides speluncae TaxID=2670337 RepID=UPI00197ED732|nr:hypothetical protein [Nocardioides speluncae]
MTSEVEVLAAVRATDWSRFSSPAVNYLWDYDPDRVIPAFEAVVQANDSESALRAEDALLHALAHNHSGTPNEAIVTGGRFLVRLVRLTDGWPRAAVISTLTQCYMFAHGVTDYRTAAGAVHDLTPWLPLVHTLAPLLREVPEGDPGASRAAELLLTLDELPPCLWIDEVEFGEDFVDVRSDYEEAVRLERELNMEISDGHPLAGRRWRVVARALPQDDVIVHAANDVAVVHLTWSGKPEQPGWPMTEFVSSAEELAQALTDRY